MYSKEERRRDEAASFALGCLAVALCAFILLCCVCYGIQLWWDIEAGR